MVATVAQILQQLEAANPEAVLLEPRSVYDKALVGITDDPKDHWNRTGKNVVAVYDTERCLKALMEWEECDYSDAQDWFGYNTIGSWLGKGTPTFVSEPRAKLS